MTSKLQYHLDLYLKAIQSGAAKTALKHGKQITYIIKEQETELKKLKLKI